MDAETEPITAKRAHTIAAESRAGNAELTELMRSIDERIEAAARKGRLQAICPATGHCAGDIATAARELVGRGFHISYTSVDITVTW